MDAELDFEPLDDATIYHGEHDCADAFDDEGLRARYFDREGKQADFGPLDDATNYYGEQACADAFDNEGFSACYFDQA